VNFAVGNPSVIEGQSANILTSRTGLWARCSTSLLEFEKYLMSLLAETKRRVTPATKFKFFTSIWQFLLQIISFLFVIFRFHTNLYWCSSDRNYSISCTVYSLLIWFISSAFCSNYKYSKMPEVVLSKTDSIRAKVSWRTCDPLLLC